MSPASKPPMKKKTTGPVNLELYEKLLATHPETERKGAANAYTAMNGNMYTLLLSSGALAIRLPKDEREKFLSKYKTKLFEAYGAVMPEYVAVPESLFGKTNELAKYLDISYEYAKTLKPKPTTKKKH